MFFAVGPWRNRGWSDLKVSFCCRSLAKQGLARFRCLFLWLVRRETGVEAIRMICFCHWSGAKQGLELSIRTVFVIGPWRNRPRALRGSSFCCWSLANERNINLKARGCRNHQEITKKNAEQRHTFSLFESIYRTQILPIGHSDLFLAWFSL